MSQTSTPNPQNTPSAAAQTPGASTGIVAPVKKTAAPAKPNASTKKTVKRTTATGARKTAAVKPTSTNSSTPGAPKKRRRRRKRTPAQRAMLHARRFFGSILMSIILVVGITSILYYNTRLTTKQKRFEMMVDEISHAKFFEGTTVEGIAVSDMTLSEAQDYWAENVEPAHASRTVYLDNGTSYTSSELGYSSNYLQVLSNAFSAGRAGSLEERHQLLSERKAQPIDYTVTRRYYTQSVMEDYVWQIAKQVDFAPTLPTVTGFDPSNNSFSFSQEYEGQRLDREQLIADIDAAFENGGGNVTMKLDPVQPEITSFQMAERYGLIASMSTSAESSNKARLANLARSCVFIDGYKIEPGATFSFNDVIGERTIERGFQVATAYSEGTVTEQVGGGICQVSSTLFNAAVMADMKINERHPHSLTVSYVDLGCDAAVNWRSRNFRFTNTRSTPVYIRASLTDDKMLRISLYGEKVEDGKKISLESKIIEEIPFAELTEKTTEMRPGKTEITQIGKNGYRAACYKVTYDRDGKQLSKKKLYESYYAPVAQITSIGIEEALPDV